MGTANFGIAGLDWQQRVNWERLKKYRTERAREHMKKHAAILKPKFDAVHRVFENELA